ncbi:MAG TPA: cytochrome P450 [Solirubrobacteraceae bacterium]|nr:cytochrome P450 [Solirubrobacteraceae bacterium]
MPPSRTPAPASPLAGPPPLRPRSPVAVLVHEVRAERANRVPYPPGETRFSMARTRRFTYEPLELLLECYERYGPIFTVRVLHGNVVFMLGPAANHYLTVSHAANFRWRDSHFRDLLGLLGDGLLTIDGEFHRRSRRIMLPAFHRERIAASLEVMIEETDRALERLEPGARVDLYAWTRVLAMRIALRALFGLDPDGDLARGTDAAAQFERALGFYATEYTTRFLRGPLTPWARMQSAARRLDRVIYGEIARRRSSGARGGDVLSLLLDARDEDGGALSDGQVRDEVMTLLFAGHDTTTSTVSFMFHELARQPEIARRLVAEQDERLSGGRPTAVQLMGGGELPQLEMVLEETLRMYPPAWIGPRRSVAAFEFEGHTVPANAYVNYSSWASQRLPDVWPEPKRFRPERFAPGARETIPKGAYVPFGGGSRTCIGMRFGELEVRTIATLILSRCALELPAGFALSIRQMPTISPREGLPVIVRERPRPLPTSAGTPAAPAPVGA